MRRMRPALLSCAATCALAGALALASVTVPALAARQAPVFTADDVFSFPFPSDLTAAPRAPRIGWAFNEQGRRNIWVAEAPAFTARQLTQYRSGRWSGTDEHYAEPVR